MVERMNMFGQQRKDGRLRKESKAGRGNGSQHRGFFLKTEKRAGGSVGPTHDQLQSPHGGPPQSTLPRQYRPKIGEALPGKIRFVNTTVRQFEWRKTPHALPLRLLQSTRTLPPT